uniref:phenylalanine--tRNA ligase n=1 Tax=Helicotheca tamesis TaxID=374047 RepID=A0A7S2H2G7_9STRA|mmetsp:Transcript_14642/g.19995  ORF Transcript_14642/g.19995 Transcript_14642/m.19995 type:complete len:646 (+) Transcript_14642:80-2017(+)|eukprot:CAMPEP_0185732054 /NCGR_PEP_ID=MMETSP1171-20130828/14803_1 /TAXON_ID=374046 /ORGANISM="Helicotheca tamensis, Strain CCMP826" /LENGTH=645 /DNA_ID=CAMNT_0028401441 /DNA_START=76 /DNA_END=2013 /DNA_ORIENTATION=+
MPTVAVKRDELFSHLNHTYTDEEFDELCFEFGVELDEITSEREEATKSSTVKLSKEKLASLSEEVIYKIDVPANRYDLLCIEGISRALKVFLGELDAPDYSLSSPESPAECTVLMDNTSTIRPFVVCAILRDVTFTPERYASFLDLQDQLHRNLCRQRSLVAIGTHDLDSVQGPFTYDARKPEEINFVPLKPDGSPTFNSKALLELYETDAECKSLKPYVPLIKDSPLYPVVLDSNDVVMSLPPIINGDHSKITLDTKQVFIECTATDLTKANIVLDTMVTMFAQYCAKPYEIEPVKVTYKNANGEITNSYTTPTLSTRKETAQVSFVNSLIGIELEATKMLTLCNKLQLGPAQLLDSNTTLEVTVPPTRSDILHPVDIAEDIAIAYGYNNIVKRVPQTCTVGGEQPLNKLTDLLRDEIGRAGYTEVLTHGLCSLHDNFTALGREEKKEEAVSLSNPANIEYEVVRTTLLPGLMKTLQHNRSASFSNGMKLFEISDVVLADGKHAITETVVGARNVRRVCAIYAGPTSGFEIVHGLVDRIMTLTEVAPGGEYIKATQGAGGSMGEEEQFRVAREGWEYEVRALEESRDEIGTYFPGRAAMVVVRNPGVEGEVVLGTFGILHPKVLKNFDVSYPASCVELDLSPLL